MDVSMPAVGASSFQNSIGIPTMEEGADPIEVAESLEAVFASMLVKEMRNTLPNGFFGEEKSDVMGGMFDLHMGNALAQRQGFGIKQLVLEQLQREADATAAPANSDLSKSSDEQVNKASL